MATPDIVVVGSLNTDLVVSVDRMPDHGETVVGRGFTTHFGGKGANQAIAAARLGARVALIGAVGEDDYGRKQIENLKDASVDVDAIVGIRAVPTGTAIIEVDEEAENRIVIIPGANEKLRREWIVQQSALLDRAQVVLLQLESPLDTVGGAISIASAGGATIILDPAPAMDIPSDWFENLDFMTPNLSELGVLLGRSFLDDDSMDVIAIGATDLVRKGVENVIVKLGARGALWVSQSQSHHWIGRSVEAIDTTAAGDCFNGAFASELAGGKSVIEAGEFAIAASALSVTKHGAQIAMPNRSAVERFLST